MLRKLREPRRLLPPYTTPDFSSSRVFLLWNSHHITARMRYRDQQNTDRPHVPNVLTVLHEQNDQSTESDAPFPSRLLRLTERTPDPGAATPFHPNHSFLTARSSRCRLLSGHRVCPPRTAFLVRVPLQDHLDRLDDSAAQAPPTATISDALQTAAALIAVHVSATRRGKGGGREDSNHAEHGSPPEAAPHGLQPPEMRSEFHGTVYAL
jgi:hypothetical protein